MIDLDALWDALPSRARRLFDLGFRAHLRSCHFIFHEPDAEQSDFHEARATKLWALYSELAEETAERMRHAEP